MLGKAIDTLSSLRHVNLNPLCSTFPTWRKVANVAVIAFAALGCGIYLFSKHKQNIKATKDTNAQLAKSIIDNTVKETKNRLSTHDCPKEKNQASHFLQSEVSKLNQKVKKSGMNWDNKEDLQIFCDTLKVLFTYVYTNFDHNNVDPKISAFLMKFFADLYHALRIRAKLEIDDQGHFTIKDVPSQLPTKYTDMFHNPKLPHYTCRILFNGLIQKLSEKKQVQEFGNLLKDPRFVLDENLHYRSSQKLFEEDLSSLFEFPSAPPTTQQPSSPPPSSSSVTSSSPSSTSSPATPTTEELLQIGEKIFQTLVLDLEEIPSDLAIREPTPSASENSYGNSAMMATRHVLNGQVTELKLPFKAPDKMYKYSKIQLGELFHAAKNLPLNADELKDKIIRYLDSIYLLLAELSKNGQNFEESAVANTAVLFAKIYHAFRQNATFTLNGDQLSFTAPETLSEDHSNKFYETLPQEFNGNDHSHARALFNQMIVKLYEKKDRKMIANLLKNPLFQQDLQNSYCKPKI